MGGYLIGVYECRVDSKARLMIPVQLKKQLGAALNGSFILKRSVFVKHEESLKRMKHKSSFKIGISIFKNINLL